MAPEKHFLEPVVDLIRRAVLVGIDLIGHHTFLGFNLIVGKRRRRGEIHKQPQGLADVFFQDRGVDDDLLFRGVGVEFAAELVEVGIYG